MTPETTLTFKMELDRQRIAVKALRETMQNEILSETSTVESRTRVTEEYFRAVQAFEALYSFVVGG